MNLKTPFLIKKIWQTDNFNFSIEWSDNLISNYRLSNLQKHCPCAGCLDQKKTQTPDNDEVKAHRISNVGRYAIRIEYTAGCSAGIYDFDLLRSLERSQ